MADTPSPYPGGTGSLAAAWPRPGAGFGQDLGTVRILMGYATISGMRSCVIKTGVLE